MKYIYLLSLILFLGACGAGSGDGLDENGQPISDQPNNDDSNNDDSNDVDDGNNQGGITLADLIDEIFDNEQLGSQRCTNCHFGSSPLGGLNLDNVALAYANLVGADGEGVQANGNASFKRVDPGNPDDSYIILKLQGDSRAGSRMPLGQAPLSDDQINRVRDWIANGAPESGGGNSPTIISKVSVNTDSEWDLAFRFSRDLSDDFSAENDVLVYLTEGNNSWLANSEDYSVKVTANTLLFRFDNQNNAQVNVVINEPGLSAVYDVNGRLLDGDFDSQDGGAFRYEYAL